MDYDREDGALIFLEDGSIRENINFLKDASSLLHLVVLKGCTRTVRRLIELGADPCLENDRGFHPIGIADKEEIMLILWKAAYDRYPPTYCCRLFEWASAQGFSTLCQEILSQHMDFSNLSQKTQFDIAMDLVKKNENAALLFLQKCPGLLDSDKIDLILSFAFTQNYAKLNSRFFSGPKIESRHKRHNHESYRRGYYIWIKRGNRIICRKRISVR